MKANEIIKLVAQKEGVTIKECKKFLIDTIAKGSFGRIEIDVDWLCQQFIHYGLTKNDAKTFFADAILPKMSASYQVRYKMYNLNK